MYYTSLKKKCITLTTKSLIFHACFNYKKVIVCETSKLDGEKCFKRLKPYNFLNTKYKHYFYIYLDNSIFKNHFMLFLEILFDFEVYTTLIN